MPQPHLRNSKRNNYKLIMKCSLSCTPKEKKVASLASEFQKETPSYQYANPRNTDSRPLPHRLVVLHSTEQEGPGTDSAEATSPAYFLLGPRGFDETFQGRADSTMVWILRVSVVYKLWIHRRSWHISGYLACAAHVTDRRGLIITGRRSAQCQRQHHAQHHASMAPTED